MRLTPVSSGSNPVYLTCTECGERRLSGAMFADLDAPPFTAYYCNPCAYQHLPSDFDRVGGPKED